jgi:deferrochelatase/peroxidase EfeB
MDPRDDPVVPFIARPLLRRGLPYGTQESTDKGLAGLFFCSDIEKQFEHLVGRWAQAPVMGLVDASTTRDLVIGQHQVAPGVFWIPEPEGSRTLRGPEQPFVRTRGCLYAWFASPAVLLRLQEYAWPLT